MENNDRFKFRVWDNKSKEYIEDGFLVSTMNDNGICQINCIKTNTSYYYSDFIIEQSTDLKDKNGKLIFEGDIIKISLGIFRIEYCNACCQFQVFGIEECFACTGDFNWYEFIEKLKDVEIIGNIRENENLINEEI